MIWNPPTKPWRHFFLNELETSWDVSTFVTHGRNARAVWGGLLTLKSWRLGLSEASTLNISKLNLPMIFFSRNEFWDIRLQDTKRNQLCCVCSKKKRTQQCVPATMSRNTTEKTHRSVEYVFRPRDVAMETSRYFPNEHARRQKHIPNTNAKETHLSWMQYAAETRPPTKNTCRTQQPDSGYNNKKHKTQRQKRFWIWFLNKDGSALHITRTWTVLSSAGSSAWLLALSTLAFYCSNSVAENGHTLW